MRDGNRLLTVLALLYALSANSLFAQNKVEKIDEFIKKSGIKINTPAGWGVK